MTLRIIQTCRTVLDKGALEMACMPLADFLTIEIAEIHTPSETLSSLYMFFLYAISLTKKKEKPNNYGKIAGTLEGNHESGVDTKVGT